MLLKVSLAKIVCRTHRHVHTGVTAVLKNELLFLSFSQAFSYSDCQKFTGRPTAGQFLLASCWADSRNFSFVYAVCVRAWPQALTTEIGFSAVQCGSADIRILEHGNKSQ